MLAIKNIFRFIQWQAARFSKFGWLCISSFMFTGLSVATQSYETVSGAFLIASIACLVAMFSMLVYTITKDQYGKFKEERQSLFNTIKNSDKLN